MLNIRFLQTFIFLLLLPVSSCNDSGKKEKEIINSAEDSTNTVKSDAELIDEINHEQQRFLDSISFYVMATNGLSLRRETGLKSEKILTMPKGSTLKMTETVFTADTIINHIRGSMVGVNYEGNEGYAYSGFLTEHFIPKNPITADEYVKIAASIKPDVVYTERENGEDFHQGYNGDLTLPYCSWHEAFYIAKAIYGIPDSFNFPNPSGSKTETITQSVIEKETWISDLYLSRNKAKLDTIHYVYRAEGYGWQVKIYAKKPNKMVIHHLAFVD